MQSQMHVPVHVPVGTVGASFEKGDLSPFSGFAPFIKELQQRSSIHVAAANTESHDVLVPERSTPDTVLLK